MERDILTHRETNSDIENLRFITKAEMELLRSSMTIRLGSMFVVGSSLLFVAPARAVPSPADSRQGGVVIGGNVAVT